MLTSEQVNSLTSEMSNAGKYPAGWRLYITHESRQYYRTSNVTMPRHLMGLMFREWSTLMTEETKAMWERRAQAKIGNNVKILKI